MVAMRNQGNQRDRNNQSENTVIDKIVKEIKLLENLSELSVDNLVKYADQMGLYLKQINLKTSQIRKFLGAVNRIKSDKNGFDPIELKMLKPKLAYAAGRQRVVKPLMSVLVPCIDLVDNKDDFKQFARLVESIVAYHRYYGGKE